MGIQFPISPLHGAQYTPPGIPVTWQYDIGRLAWRVVRGGTAWIDITGKPATFPPSPHQHPIIDVTGLQAILDVKQDISARAQANGYASLDSTAKVPRNQLPDGLGITWDDIDNKPSQFPPSPHTHPVVEISDSSSVGQQLVRAPDAFAARNVIGAIGIDDNARVSVKNGGTVIGIRRGINFVAGTNTTLAITDDVANEDVDVVINATGGSGGGSTLLVTEIKPAAPADSTLWLDVGTGLLFTYYFDGVRRQWIEAIPYLASMPAAFPKFMFPAAPIDGQTYNPIPGAIWKWSSTRGVWFAVLQTSTSYTKAESDAAFVDVAGDTMTGALTLSGDPTANLQAATKQYVDARVFIQDTAPSGAPDKTLWWESDTGNLYIRYNDGNSSQWVLAAPQSDSSLFIQKAGDNMTGPLGLVADPTVALQAATKQYVDAVQNNANAKVAKAGDTMTGPLVLAADPAASLQAATKQYVDVVQTSANAKVAKTGDTMTGPLTISAGNLTVAGSIFGTAGNFSLGGVPAIASGGNYVNYFDRAGNGALILGSGGDVSNYYRNNHHYFQTSAGGGGCAVTVAGYVSVDNGYACHSGVSSGGSGYGGNSFNIQYSGGNSYLYIDDTFMGVFAYQSDYRIKKDVVALPDMWDTVKQLRPIKYTQAAFTPASALEFSKKSGEAFIPGDDVERWGFIAHELQETLTESAATGTKDIPDAIQSPNPFTLIAALTKALQEAMMRIEALEAR